MNIIIFGSSGHAGMAIDIIKSSKDFNLVGLIDNEKTDSYMGINILCNDDNVGKIIKEHNIEGYFIAIGSIKIRKKVFDYISSNFPHIKAINLIDQSAILSKNCNIGKGNIIMPGAIINTNSIIGDFNIINTNASLDHDNEVENFCNISPGVITGGNTTIKSFSNIGLGSNIINDIIIGENCIVGAGSLILKNTDSNSKYWGQPAKKIK